MEVGRICEVGVFVSCVHLSLSVCPSMLNLDICMVGR